MKIEEKQKTFDREFHIGLISKCKYNEDSSSNDEKRMAKSMKKGMMSSNKIF